MSLKEQIMVDLKAAMKAKDVATRDALRMLKTALTEKELKGPIDEAAALDVVKKAVKTRRESAAQYDEAGRTDLAEKERSEITALEKYLPAQLSEDEVRSAMEALAAELGVTEKKQMGQLIKAAKAKFPGQLDGKLAAKIAGSILS